MRKRIHDWRVRRATRIHAERLLAIDREQPVDPKRFQQPPFAWPQGANARKLRPDLCR